MSRRGAWGSWMPNAVSVNQLLDDLSSRGVELWVEDDKLRFRAPLGSVTTDIRDFVSAQRSEIVAHLRAISGGASRDAARDGSTARDGSLEPIAGRECAASFAQ